MALLKRHYNLRKRNHKGYTDGTTGKKSIPELRQCRHKRNHKPTKKLCSCPRPRKRQTAVARTTKPGVARMSKQGVARMTKQQLAQHEYEIERKKRALVCREQAVARMERAIARRERTVRLWEKTYMQPVVVKRERTTSPTKKCPGRKPKAGAAVRQPSPPDPEVVIVHHYDRDHPRSAATTIDLTSTTETTTTTKRRREGSTTETTTTTKRQRREGQRSRAKDSVSLRIINALGRRLATKQKPTPAKVKPPSDTMFSGQGSNVRWQPSIFPMVSSVPWPTPQSLQRPTPSYGQPIKTEPEQPPATH